MPLFQVPSPFFPPVGECWLLSELPGKKRGYGLLSWGSGPSLPSAQEDIRGPHTYEGRCQQHRTMLTALEKSTATPRVLASPKLVREEYSCQPVGQSGASHPPQTAWRPSCLLKVARAPGTISNLLLTLSKPLTSRPQ